MGGSAGFVEVGPGCFVARYPEWDVNVGLVVGSDGTLVIDTRAGVRQGAAALSDASRVSRHEVRWVVNTHDHFDHVLGNAAFPAAEIHAHEDAASAMPDSVSASRRQFREGTGPGRDDPAITADIVADLQSSPLVLPTRTFSSAAVIDLGDRYVELLHLGRGHTSGDLVVRVPDADVVYAGDLVEESPSTSDTPGYGDDCWPLEWAPTLDLLIGLLGASTVIVPGHGSPVSRPFVEGQRDDIADVAELIRALATAGVPLDEALAEGTRTPRPAPLAESVRGPGPAGPRVGWPFPPELLEHAVHRGFAHLAAAAPRRQLPLVTPDGT